MKNKLLATVALAFAVSAGAAFAQEPGGNPPVIQSPPAGVAPQDSTDPMTSDSPGVTYQQFYTDEAMTELRGAEENRTAFMAMPVDEQQALREECAAVAAADPSVQVGEETTGSIEPGNLPPTIASLCQQMSTWQ